MSDARKLAVGAEYVRVITANESDRRSRRIFQELALTLAASGETLFDFGSGPGIDARFYAEHGRRVLAFDVDPGMCAYLSDHCSDLIFRGAVTLYCRSYREFLAGAAADGTRVTLVTANFAPLNLIDDLRELFARFDSLTGPNGAVLASVLCPYFAGDLRYLWWWRNLGRLAARGRYYVPGAQSRIWRRRLADFADQCAPHFALETVFAGNRRRQDPVAGRGAWLRLIGSRYMFLLFRKRAAQGAAPLNALNRAP
jgi:SAM-dependent methyltransferase